VGDKAQDGLIETADEALPVLEKASKDIKDSDGTSAAWLTKEARASIRQIMKTPN
jgi:hypothetical protein